MNKSSAVVAAWDAVGTIVIEVAVPSESGASLDLRQERSACFLVSLNFNRHLIKLVVFQHVGVGGANFQRLTFGRCLPSQNARILSFLIVTFRSAFSFLVDNIFEIFKVGFKSVYLFGYSRIRSSFNQSSVF